MEIIKDYKDSKERYKQCEDKKRTLFVAQKKTENKQAREAARKAYLESERAKLQTELANLKGLFSIFRRKEIETRLSEIEAELNKL